MKVSTDIFIMGIMLGWGPCLSFCMPIVMTLIAGTQKGSDKLGLSLRSNLLKGLWSILAFSLARVFTYIVLAVIATGIGQLVVRQYYEGKFGYIIYPIVGIIIIIFGLLLIFSRGTEFKFCSRFIRNPLQNNLKGMVILGLVIGFSPCVPLFGVLSYIAFEAKNFWQAIFYGSCFGAGTMLTLLIPIGALAGCIPSLIRLPKVFDIFRRACGGYLVYLGMKLAL